MGEWSMSIVRRAAATVIGLMSVGACSSTLAAEAIRIVATDSGFEAPRTVAAGLRHILFENHGKGIHEAMFTKLAAGTTADDFTRQVKAGVLFPVGGLDYSGAGLTSPGESTELWLRLDPGEYVLICWNHSRSSIQSLAVRDVGQADDAPPREDVVLKLRDFSFTIEGRLKRGAQVVRVETPGPSMHEADLFRLHDGRTATDVKRWYKNDLEGEAPADSLGGVLDSHNIKRVVWLKKTFSPGRYVLHCAVPVNHDARSGEHTPVHADLGMVATFEIEK
jgi:uncharacterized cupredoxin-like copper-binding protein